MSEFVKLFQNKQSIAQKANKISYPNVRDRPTGPQETTRTKSYTVST